MSEKATGRELSGGIEESMQAWRIRRSSARERGKACGREPAAHGDDFGPIGIGFCIGGLQE